MSASWALVLLMTLAPTSSSVGNSATSATVYFGNRDLCEAAERQAAAKIKDAGRTLVSFCTLVGPETAKP